MAEQRAGVGISNRRASEQEDRERQQYAKQGEEPVEPAEAEPGTRELQTSTKSGARASAQKEASARHVDRQAPSAAKVQGAFGREPD